MRFENRGNWKVDRSNRCGRDSNGFPDAPWSKALCDNNPLAYINEEATMTQDESQDRSAGFSEGSRGPDRRFCTQLAPPPYPTASGLIFDDRRQYLDRRASWVKDFFMDIGDKEAD